MTNIITPAEARVSTIHSPQSDRGSGPRSGNELRETAKHFEAIFLRQMIASMRSPSWGDDLFGSDAANQFRDMSDAHLADTMAGQFGIAQMLERQLGK